LLGVIHQSASSLA
jgi:hypothetical protein